MGKGLVGTAAKDRMIITNEYFNRKHLYHDRRAKPNRRLWMAAPILFEKQILGVIAIGEPGSSNGTEKDLLSIVAQIAGVVLYHQSFLIRARRNADTDVLTGLHNRRYFYRMSRRFVEKATQEGTSISILLIDLDYFKHYNDTSGHDEGDRLLIEFSGLLRGCTPDDAVVARYGGEEFIVMLPNVSTDDAFQYAEYLRNTVANHPFPHRETQPFGFLSISGGIACFPNHGRSIQEVVRLADTALYKAKETGRNRIVSHRFLPLPGGRNIIPPARGGGSERSRSSIYGTTRASSVHCMWPRSLILSSAASILSLSIFFHSALRSASRTGRADPSSEIPCCSISRMRALISDTSCFRRLMEARTWSSRSVMKCNDGGSAGLFPGVLPHRRLQNSQSEDQARARPFLG